MRNLITTLVAVIVMLVLSAVPAYAGGGDTAFTYQGRLLDAGEPANGVFDIGFGLWDAAVDGNQAGTTQMLYFTPVSDGLFTVQIDFGADAFNNSDRWMEISVDGTTLNPRQPITRTPYAIQTRGIIVNENENVGIGISPNSSRLRAWNFAGNAFEALSSSRAVEAISTGDMAILASNQSADGMGVFAQHQPSGNQGWLGTPDYGVYGVAGSPAWAGYFLGDGYFSGFVGIGTSEPEAPLHVHEGSAGDVAAQSNSIAVFERAGHGFISILTPDASERGILFGDPEFLANGAIVYNNPTVPDGFEFRTGGNNTNMVIDAAGNVGIGTTAPYFPLEVVAVDGAIFGKSTAGVGMNTGVLGQSSSTTGHGVFGRAQANTGFCIGVLGSSSSPDGFGVYSSGNCHVSGTLSKSGGSFKIDHPLDPENKYLQHSFVESPDMMNVYNGNVILDENGTVQVLLPDYFDGLNRDYRYQLTPMGAAMPNLHIAKEIANNSFRIAGGKARMKVSWQVTGIRQDPWAQANRIEVEPYKQPEDQGKYLNPELYGQPKEMGVHYIPASESPVTDTALAKVQVEQTLSTSTGELK